MATGTASGTLDSSFSNDAKLELWSPFDGDVDVPRGSVAVGVRFNRIAWGNPVGIKSKGLIAAGMENSELHLWDPVKILKHETAEASLVSKMTNHTGPVKALDFNPIKHNLLASGATKAEVFIWDMNNPVKPFAPPPSRSLDDVTSVSWNHIVQSVLAVSSNNGYTVVWDIREANGQKGREVATLSYIGSVNQIPAYGQSRSGNLSGPQYGSRWMTPSVGRAGSVSSVVWHPENPTKLATSSEDDAAPIVLIWDLRNARAPERILSGHEKGVLSLAWCQKDVDLLVSCGKDCRTVCWNPTSGELVAELPPSSNWSFQTAWCPQNPDLVATASFDARIAIHSLQSTNDESDVSRASLSAPVPADGSDIFGDRGILAMNSARAAVSLKQVPRWYKRPASATFTFGGRLVMIFHPMPRSGTGAENASESKSSLSVRIQQVVTEPTLVERALRLEDASQARNLHSLCEERANQMLAKSSTKEVQNWRLLTTLFKTESRDELISLLDFSKEEVKIMVERLIESHRASKRPTGLSRVVSEVGPAVTLAESGFTESESITREPLVTFADVPTERSPVSSEAISEVVAGVADPAPSEDSVSAISEGLKTAEVESEITEPSLFGDDNANVSGPTAASLDFYSSMRNGRPASLPDHLFSRVSQAASSVGATLGSRTSSLASENVKTNTFQIYPKDGSQSDRLITKALVLGDFESAVSLCISTERFADAILLAVRGGTQLLQRAQKAYLDKQTVNLPYLRLYHSIAMDDLVDIVQNAELSEWQEIFVIVCTFANKDEFSNLLEQLGQRIEYFSHLSPANKLEASAYSQDEYRNNAILCYLAAGKLDKVVSIWLEQMREEEEAFRSSSINDRIPGSAFHADVLQAFIEKVAIFKSAINYVDLDLAHPTESSSSAVSAGGVRTYKLAGLYDCYCEYAELLASQGLVNTALRFIAQTPLDYGASFGRTFSVEMRERLSKSIGLTSIVSNSLSPSEQKTPTIPTKVQPLDRLLPETLPAHDHYQNAYNQPSAGRGFTSSNYNPAAGGCDSASATYSTPYESSCSHASPNTTHYTTMTTAGSFLPPPPVTLGSSPIPTRAPNTVQLPPPPASRHVIGEVGGWNDAPVVNAARKSLAPAQKQVITSPFPHPNSSMVPPQHGGYNVQPAAHPPVTAGSTRPLQTHSEIQSSVHHSMYPPSTAPLMYPQPLQQGGAFPGGQPQQIFEGRGQIYHSVGKPAGFTHSPREAQRAVPPAPTSRYEAPKSKYPDGDRSHIPETSRPIYVALQRLMNQIKQVIPKKMVDDTERRLNVLFDALNCGTVPREVIDELLDIVKAIENRNLSHALQLHVSLLTSGVKSDELTTYMPAIKMLITKLQ